MFPVYVARYLSFVGGTQDETEEFVLPRLSPLEVEARIRSGEIRDGMTIAAWFLAGPDVARSHFPWPPP